MLSCLDFMQSVAAQAVAQNDQAGCWDGVELLLEYLFELLGHRVQTVVQIGGGYASSRTSHYSFKNFAGQKNYW